MPAANLTFGDAVVVAVCGGVGTIVGGFIASLSSYWIKGIETRAQAELSVAEARRRQGERQVLASHAVLDSLVSCRAKVLLLNAARIGGSGIGMPSHADLASYRTSATECRTLAARLNDAVAREAVSAAFNAVEALFADRNIQTIAESQESAEQTFQRAVDALASAIAIGESRAVETKE